MTVCFLRQRLTVIPIALKRKEKSNKNSGDLQKKIQKWKSITLLFFKKKASIFVFKMPKLNSLKNVNFKKC